MNEEKKEFVKKALIDILKNEEMGLTPTQLKEMSKEVLEQIEKEELESQLQAQDDNEKKEQAQGNGWL